MATKQQSIVILTGAGISAESGIKTFRDHNGLWENYSVTEVASIKGFKKNPDLVNRFYNERRAQLLEPSIEPNAAHYALAQLEQAWNDQFLLVTQNVDNLHERAGSKQLCHMHGELLKARCLNKNRVVPWSEPITEQNRCSCCQPPSRLRPHIVWFGETPLEMERINTALYDCDIFISIGTSGNVYPAADFVGFVPAVARKIEINLEKSMVSSRFTEHYIGIASECVPKLVNALLQGESQ